MRAKIVHRHRHDGAELVEVGGHRIQYGDGGDGFCYAHQSFDCADRLTPEERDAVQRAEDATSATPDTQELEPVLDSGRVGQRLVETLNQELLEVSGFDLADPTAESVAEALEKAETHVAWYRDHAEDVVKNMEATIRQHRELADAAVRVSVVLEQRPAHRAPLDGRPGGGVPGRGPGAGPRRPARPPRGRSSVLLPGLLAGSPRAPALRVRPA